MNSTKLCDLQHDSIRNTVADKPLPIKLMRQVKKLLPGDYLKTAFYMTAISKPRRLLRQFINGFYRVDHIYEVINEVKKLYHGKFSILEFGSADGYSFIKMLYATRYLRMEDRVTVHSFDTFEGMPASEDPRDDDLVVGDSWQEGQFPGRYEKLISYCQERYKNFGIHKGYFEDSLSADFLETLRFELPILIWIDCDFYTSTRSVFEQLIPYIPTGCVVYFDDYELLNYGSRFTGEARVVSEINSGHFGPNFELVLDRKLSMDSQRCYRFVRNDRLVQYTPRPRQGLNSLSYVRPRGDGSALP